MFVCVRQGEQDVRIKGGVIIGDVLACPVHRLVAVDTSACGQRESGRDPAF